VLPAGAKDAKDNAAAPNVLFIVADDLRAEALAAYGGTLARTPHLDRLAARGCVFTRATCGYPICHVSRTEMLTGCNAFRHGAGYTRREADPALTLWPAWMQQHGWTTWYSGKWHSDGTPWTRGYTATGGLFSSGGSRGAPLTRPLSATGRGVTGYTGWTFKRDDRTPRPEQGVGLTPQTDAHIADGALSLLAQKRERPFFLHVNFTAPHDPLHWPPGGEGRFEAEKIALPANFRAEHPFDHGNLRGRDERIVPAPRTELEVQRERAVYLALVEHVDVQIGRLVAALESTGQLERTLILFTSDHGLALGSHGLMGKQNMYEHTIGVPLLIAGPGVPAGQRVAAQCHLRDLYPTVCELAGLAIPPTVQGRSLVPVLRGERAEVQEEIFGYFTDTQRMLRTADGWKLVWYPKLDRRQLFHIAEDPGELRDLVADPAHRARLESMSARLRAWLGEQGDPVE
jgi:arylsulfatase A-like enzyme